MLNYQRVWWVKTCLKMFEHMNQINQSRLRLLFLLFSNRLITSISTCSSPLPILWLICCIGAIIMHVSLLFTFLSIQNSCYNVVLACFSIEFLYWHIIIPVMILSPNTLLTPSPSCVGYLKPTTRLYWSYVYLLVVSPFQALHHSVS